MTLVCQDWGGLIGLTTVTDVPKMFSKLVIMNTGLPSPVLDFNDDNGDPVVGPASILTKLQNVIEKIQTQIIIFPRNSIVPSLYPGKIPGTFLHFGHEEAQC